MKYLDEETYSNIIKKFVNYIKCDHSSSTDYDLFTQQLDEIGFCRAQLQYEVAIAEIELKRATALAYVKIKTEPDSYGLVKASETAIKILIEADPSVIEMSTQVAKSNLYLNRINSLYSSMYAKKSWLEIEAKRF